MNLIHLQDPAQAFPGVSFPGIEYYPDRALVESGGVALVPGPIEEVEGYLGYLQGLGVGVRGVISFPPGQGPYEVLRDNHLVQKEVRRLVVEDGYRPRFFNTRGGVEERLLVGLGLDIDIMASPPSRLADLGNNKAELRRIAAQLGRSDRFPPHMIVSGVENLEMACERMLARFGQIAIKRPFLATGIGMVFGGAEALPEFLAEGAEDLNDIIVEEALWPHVSMTVVFGLERGRVKELWFSEQGCQKDPAHEERVVHEWSVLGRMPRVAPDDTKWLIEASLPLLTHFLNLCPGVTGNINFDGLRHIPSGRRFLTEANVRQTLSSYLFAIQQDIGRQKNVEPTCLMQRVSHANGLKTFDDLREVLGDLLLTDPQGEGVIPVAPRCIRYGYFYPVAVADTYEQARALMDRARERLA